ncbi:putative Ig domain-containing protein, partial [Sansalvadorimonas verongulae]|uniref:putative Ig domain-containing protein n=1 Tax=Sansalvadorimonas verongulae TaxID=2172824 RepID=UPI0018AD1846
SLTNVNDDPVLDSGEADKAFEDGEAITAINVKDNFSDADNDPLTLSVTGLPAGLSFDSDTGLITGTLGTSASQSGAGGVYTVLVEADDGNNGTVAQDSFTITVTNPAPDFTGETDGTDNDTYTFNNVPEGTAAGVIGTVTANDEGDTLTYTLENDQRGLFTINSTSGEIRTTRTIDDADLDDYTLTVNVSDGEGGT